MNEQKSPRDWLLARHAHAQPQLDALRRAALLPAQDPVEPDSLTWREFLLQLFRPHRGVWRALAAVWLALALFQVTRVRVSTPSAQPAPSSEAFTAWLGQLKSHEAFAQIDRRP